MRISREKFESLLDGHAEFLKITNNSKAPVSSFKKDGPNRYQSIPKKGNYGVIPRGRLIVLDVDTHRYDMNLDEQVAAFSVLLGVDLKETLTVTTPSGGRHFYLLLPEDADPSILPKTTLRSAKEEIRELAEMPDLSIDADIRSAAALAYAIGPGSCFRDFQYQVSKFAPVLEVPSKGYENLVQVRNLSEKRKRKTLRENRKKFQENATEEFESFDTVPAETIEKLRYSLLKSDAIAYHEKRSVVKAALHCCYSDVAIARACRDLEIDKDTFTGRRIRLGTIISDMAKFHPTHRYHGGFCPIPKEKKRAELKAVTFDPEKMKARQKARRASGKSWRTMVPRVVDVPRVHEMLMKQTNRSKPTSQIVHALWIVDELIQPLSNIGILKLRLPLTLIQANLGLTKSQASQALRLLRQTGVIAVTKKQHQGATCLYVLSGDFVHEGLTKGLRSTWATWIFEDAGESMKPACLWSAEDAAFNIAATGEQVFISDYLKTQGELDPIVSGLIPKPSRRETRLLKELLSDETQWLDSHQGVRLKREPRKAGSSSRRS